MSNNGSSKNDSPLYKSERNDLLGFSKLYAIAQSTCRVNDMPMGSDIYYLLTVADTLPLEDPDGGHDRVYSRFNFILPDNFEDLVLSGLAIRGVGNNLANLLVGNQFDNDLRGLGGDDFIYGGDGNDRLDGGAGYDILSGGTGDDSYILNDSWDNVVELAGEGRDTVYVSFSYALSYNVEDLVLTGSLNLKGFGNELNNVIIGNARNNLLYGGDGNDILRGGGGLDSLYGGSGDDTYYIDTPGTVVLEEDGAGTDTVYTSVSYILSENVEILRGSLPSNGSYKRLSLTGNDLDNVIYGLYSDIVDGGLGADTMYGGYIFYVDNPGDIVIADEGSGAIVQTSISYILPNNVNQLDLLGSDDLNGTGNNSSNNMFGNSGANIMNGGDDRDHLYGASGNDILYGEVGNDSLYGGDGDDILEGGVGRDFLDNVGGGLDVMTGGEGADVFAFSSVAEAGNVMKITDFEPGVDRLLLWPSSFPALPWYTFDPAAFHVGTEAQNADQHVIYNDATGDIFYDANGNGEGQAILIAQVTAGTALTASDIITWLDFYPWYYDDPF